MSWITITSESVCFWKKTYQLLFHQYIWGLLAKTKQHKVLWKILEWQRMITTLGFFSIRKYFRVGKHIGPLWWFWAHRHGSEHVQDYEKEPVYLPPLALSRSPVQPNQTTKHPTNRKRLKQSTWEMALVDCAEAITCRNPTPPQSKEMCYHKPRQSCAGLS